MQILNEKMFCGLSFVKKMIQFGIKIVYEWDCVL